MSIANEDVTVAQLMEFVCTNLPAGWEVLMWMREGASGVVLSNGSCEANLIEVRQGGQTYVEMVVKAVNHARLVKRLDPVDFPSQWESFR